MPTTDIDIVLNTIFSPTSPIKEKDFFSGRKVQLEKIVAAINENGQHAILYGERGVGKTSLANIMCKSITNIYPVKITCSRSDTFKTLWERILDEIKYSKDYHGIGFTPEKTKAFISLGQILSIKEHVLPGDVLTIMSKLNDKYLFIFDEFDNITNNKTRSSFSDLIKSLSDNLENITIVIVGIADNVENLIINHQSLERCLMQVKMPRMSDQELEDIINKGFGRLSIKIPAEIKKKIVGFSSGFPHYTHLLCKFCASNCVSRKNETVELQDLDAAIKLAVENTSEQLRLAYRKAILTSSSKSQWKEVLFACALAECDEFDGFSTTDVLDKFKKIIKKNNANITYNLGKFCREEKGSILEKIGVGRNFKYRFVNPMMKAYIKLNMN